MVDEKPLLSRREARKLDRREAILEVAVDHFLQHGYAATTMSEIAAVIGGSKATLWSYFPSKEALFEAVLDRVTTLFRQQMIALLDPSSDLEAALRGFCRRFIEKVTSPDAVALYRLIIAEAGRFPEVGTIFYQRGPDTTLRFLAEFIGLGMARGALRPGDPRQAATILIALSMSGCHQQLLFGRIARVDAAQIAADADAAVDVLLRTYAP
jgi:TetR/AcrR family transcriptional repressor of mexJK operon